MNKFILKGYIGNIESKKNYTKVSIATTRPYKNDAGEYESDWFNCVAFNSTSDFISKYFDNGDMILCEGNIQNNNYTDDKGETQFNFSFIISSVEFCGKKATTTKAKEKNTYKKR